ncbi:hypothetical protein ACHQM5_003621 [Ranunculus cassubicifolius]
MEFFSFQSSSWPFLFNPATILPPLTSFDNYVHWTETQESHIYTADLPGVKKEEIKVELEDSRYLIIRTEAVAETSRKQFLRKFRLPAMINIGEISACFEDGVLRVTVPRSSRRGIRIDPADLPDRHEILAPAA